ncbi:MAG TPA: RDD family protein [Acidimicrobiia bacterium]|jgi:uncharacterized RDD family membrane protein YckC|nr:RDD family protein [Acidimicrobiia bacterium]
MTTPPEFPTEQPAASPANLASWGTRALGLVVDWVPAFILSVLTYRASVFVSLLGYAYWAYLGHLEGVTGQTPGKAMQGIRLVNEKGEVLGSGTGIARKFVHILDFIVCGLGFLLPIVDTKRQTIADKVMNTYVVEGVEKKPFSIDLWMPPKA